ncbi:MAG: thermonuclease family protein [Alphaproteobacteria bacterium]|nr:thermonuclease family protein [Alphaproteobacteria bacterium]
MQAMRTLVAAVLVALATGVPAVAQELRPKEVSGRAVVVDGDTMRVGLAVIRLWGVDAPEITSCRAATEPMKPFCGTAQAETSRTSLERIIGTVEVRCTEVTRDSFGQMMGECFAGRTNIGLEQIRSGNAVAWPT